MEIKTFLLSLAVGSSSVVFGADALDASVDQLIASKKAEQHAVCVVRAETLMIPSRDQRAEIARVCSEEKAAEIDFQFVELKSQIQILKMSV
jgi:hypothetical protein